MPSKPTTTHRRIHWLPNFCSWRTLGPVLVGSEMVVLIGLLLPSPHQNLSLTALLIHSVLGLWIAFITSLILCALQSRLARLSVWPAITLASLVPPTVAFLIGALACSMDETMNLGLGLGWASAWSFSLSLAGATLVLTLGLFRYFYVRTRWKQQIRAQAQAQVEALQARIRPHFLFNSMNTIASLIRRQPKEAEQAVEALSDLFRAALGADAEKSWSLADEVDLCERYLTIETLRFGDRLQATWHIHDDVPRHIKLPRLLLQPLIENAVVHGVASMQAECPVDINIHADSQWLTVVVSNPCAGDDARSKTKRNGHALDNIRHRIQHHFGSNSQLTHERHHGMYRCTMRLSLKEEPT